jgi:hypothetical protein
MIRKSGNRFSLATNADFVCAGIMLKKKDAIMMRFLQTHHDLAHDFLTMLAAGFLASFRGVFALCSSIPVRFTLSGAGAAAYRHCRLVDAPG